MLCDFVAAVASLLSLAWARLGNTVCLVDCLSAGLASVFEVDRPPWFIIYGLWDDLPHRRPCCNNFFKRPLGRWESISSLFTIV